MTAKFAELPLYAEDKALGEAVLGKGRGKEFVDTVPTLERAGFPKINPMMGGRYTPAVKAWFDNFEGVTGAAPMAADGVESMSWKISKGRKRPD